MQNLKFAAARLLTSVSLAVASLFDRGIESVIGDLVKVGDKLDSYIARQDARFDKLGGVMDASRSRVDQVVAAERTLRGAVIDKRYDILAATERAERVRARIAKLLD